MKKTISKLSYGKVFKQFFIQSFIELEEFLYKLPLSLESVILVIGSIQNTTFFMHTQNFKTFRQLPYIFSMICNPSFFIQNDSDNQFASYCYLIVLGLLILYLYPYIVLYKKEIIVKKGTDFSISCIYRYNLVERLLFYYAAYFSQLFLTVLIFPLSQLLQISFKASMNINNNLSYLNGILCIILLLLLFGIALFKISVSLESSNIVPQGFNLLLVTNFQAIQFFILILQICISFFSMEQYPYLQAGACLIAAVLKLTELFSHYTQPNFSKVRALLFAKSYCIIISVFNIFRSILNENNDNLSVLVIMVHPLVYRVLLFYYEDSRFLTLFKIQNNSHPKVQQFQLNLILTEFKGCYVNPLIVKAMLIHQHISECQELVCFCHKIVCITNVPKYAQAMLPQHAIQLVLHLSQDFLHSLRLLGINDQAIYYIHYISLINSLGQSSQAYNQIGLIMEGKVQTVKKRKVRQSQALIALGLYKQNSNTTFKSHNDSEKFDDPQTLQNLVISGIYKIKILILKQRAKTCIRQYLVIQNNTRDALSDSVQRFMKTEEANVKLKQRILKVVIMKIAFLKMINQEEEIEKGTSLYLNTFRLIRKIMKLNDVIEQLYLQFPSSSIQSVYSFYSAEIMNDYLQAFTITNTGGIYDDKVNLKSKKVTFDLLNSRSTYVNLAIDDSTYGLKIIGASKNAHLFFGFNLDEFSKVSSPNALIPQCVQIAHNNIVKNFFNTGKSKYFRETAMAFTHVKSGALKQIDAFYDIDFKKESFVAQLFIYESIGESAYIIAGMNNAISGITENILSILQFKDTQINQVFKIFSQVNIKYFIPSWKFITEKFNQEQKETTTKSTKQIGKIETVRENQTLFDMDFNFICEKKLKQIIQEHPNSENLTEIVLEEWKYQENINVYTASIIVNKQTVDNIYYYIIEINELKFNNNHHYHQLLTQFHNKEDDNFYPSSNQDIQQGIIIKQDSHLDEMALLLKQFDISLGDISQEDIPNPPNIAQNLRNVFEVFDAEDSKFGVKLQYLEKPLKMSSKIEKQLINSVLSPKISQSKPLINEQQSVFNIKGNQQKFYQDHEEISIQPSFENFQKSENQNNFNQFKVEQDGQDESFQMKDRRMSNKQQNYQNDKQYKQYEASSISSTAGVRNSRFFKKYSNLHQYYLQNSQSYYFEIFIKSIVISLLISLTYVLLEFATFQFSSQFLLDVLNTLSIQQTVMGPLDQILLTVDSIDRYNQLKKQYPDQKEFFQNLQNYSITSLPIFIKQFKEQYRKQLESVQIGYLLDDQTYYTVKSINLTQTSNENLPLRSLLDIIDMKVDDIYVKLSGNYSTEGWKIQSFQFNMINFELLTQIFRYLKHKTIQLAHLNVDQWTQQEDIIFYILLSLFLFACLFSFFFLLLHRYRIEEFLQLFQKIDQNHLKKDQERFKMINKLLTRDIDVMFKYRFELTEKEKAILSYEKALEFGQKTKEKKRQAVKQTKNKIDFNINKRSSIFYFIFTCSMCIGVLSYMHIQIQDYIDSFKISANIFSVISEKSSNIPESYCIKQIAYNTLNPDFPIGAFKNHSFYEQYILNTSLIQLDLLVQFLSHIEQSLSQSLATSDFINFVQQKNENNVCNLFDQQKQTEIIYFCQTAFEGALSRGLVQAINTVKQSLQNEYEVNHLTIAPENIAFGENEALNILLEVFDEISRQFQSTIYSQTASYQNILYVSGSLFLSYVTLHFLFLKLFYYDLNLKEYQIIKKCYILLPSMSLMIDLQLERKLRLLYWQEKT